MKKISTLLFLLIQCTLLLSQVIYYNRTFGNGTSNHYSEIGTIDVSNCDINIIYDTIKPPLNDIAIDQNGDIYGSSGLFSDTIYKVDAATGELIYITNGQLIYSIAISNENILYGLGDSILYSFDLNGNGTFEMLGVLPYGNGYIFSGLAFEKCRLLTSSPPSVIPYTNQITEVNLVEPANSPIVGETAITPNLFFGLGGIIGYQDGCSDNSRLFIVGPGLGLFSLYEYDMEINSYSLLCDNFIFSNNFSIASPTEALQPSFRPAILLDPNSSSGLPTPDYQAPENCNNTFPISDTDITIDICHGVDSLRIWLAEGQTDGLNETIIAAANADITVLGDQSSELLLINNGDAENTDFATLVSNSLYSNNATTMTSGLRKIAFVGYCGYFAGDTAYAYITIQELPSAGADAQLSLCLEDPVINLFDQLSNNPEPNGTWQPLTLNGNGLFDPLADAAGIYYYIVGEAGCPMDTAEVLVEILESPFWEFLDVAYFCAGDTFIASTGISNITYTHEWQDGSTDVLYQITSPGLYWVEVTNTDGCSYRDSFLLEEIFSYEETLMVSICKGESFLFEGILLENDTSYCITYNTVSGCDSTRCIELVSTAVFLSEIAVEICAGETYSFGNEVFDQSGYYVDSLLSYNGCDSFVTLLLEVVPVPVLNLEEIYLLPKDGSLTINAGNDFSSYNWSNGESSSSVMITIPGEYSLTVSDAFGCNSSTTFSVNSSEAYYLPNAFSPNGDGFNDFFTLYPGPTVAAVSLMRVYDRWGEKVFEASPLQTDRESRGWDGTFRGEAAPNGVYLYWLEIVFTDGRAERVTGDLVLLR